MIIAFFGHARFKGTKEYEEKLLAFLEENIADKAVDMYLGGYGAFDEFAYDCCIKYKSMHNNVSLILVTPYITEEYCKNHLEYQLERYDGLLYPKIEDKPLRFAINYRNRYMIEKADYVIAYVNHNSGGAYAAYVYAKRKQKSVFNIADLE